MPEVFLNTVIRSFSAWRSVAITRGGVKKKPTSLLVVSLGKEPNGTPRPSSGRQVATTFSAIKKIYKKQITKCHRISGPRAHLKVVQGNLQNSFSVFNELSHVSLV